MNLFYNLNRYQAKTKDSNRNIYLKNEKLQKKMKKL